MDGPTVAQLLWIAAAAALLVAGTIASLRRTSFAAQRTTNIAEPEIGSEAGQPKLPVKAKQLPIKRLAILLSLAGLAAGLIAQSLHAVYRHNWLPLQDNFDALLWLAILLAAASLYLRRTPAMTPIDWIATPIAVLLMAGAAVYGKARPHEYTDSLWSWTHRLSAYASPLAFALAAGAGVAYLTLRSKLRNHKHAPLDAKFGSLERYERVNYLAVQIGFALLTVGLVSGLIRALGPASKLGDHWWMSPKVLLSFGTYAVYAVVLHSPINPAFRGSKTAVLSIAGFVLLLGTLVAVQQMK